jgi:putative aldouronate transport system substrate-binding protein
MSKTTTKRIVSAMAAAVMLTSSAGFVSGAAAAPAAEEYPKVSFSMMGQFENVEPPKEDNMMLTWLRENMNADIEFTWVPTTAYEDKMAAQIAAADLPNVIVARSPKNSVIVNAVRIGMFWELDPYITPDYPSLDRLNKDVLENIRIDGKVYALPRESDVARSGVYWRQDWLDNVGLEAPANIDEIYEIIKAFTENDPDGDGQDNTTGVSMKGRNLNSFVRMVAMLMGGTNQWYLAEDGTIKNEVETPEYLQALNWWRDVYENGYIVSDFTVNDDENVPIEQGRAGFVFATTVGDITGRVNPTRQVFPEAEFDFTQDLVDPNGRTPIIPNVGYVGAIMFPKTTTKTEAQLLPIIEFFDRLGRDENVLVLRKGFEGVHYTIDDDGYIVSTPEQNEQFNTVDFPDVGFFNPFRAFKNNPERQADPLRQKLADSYDKNIPNIVPNMSDWYISETSTSMTTPIEDIITDARMKFVLGEIDEDGWNAAVAEWKEAGGDAIAADYTEAHKARMGE